MKDKVAYLVVTHGPTPNKKYALTQETNMIGRADASDVAIADQEVSRQHAQIIRQGDGFAIEDLGSTNGTFVNDHRVSSLTLLENGDVIELGESVSLTFLSLVAEEYDAATYFDPVEEEPTQPEFPELPARGEMPQISPAAEDAVIESESIPLRAMPQPVPNRRRWWLGCGCGCLLLVLLCAAALFFLDAYDGGRLLYCGPLQPFFELVLGPVGFSPPCALP